MPDLDTQLDAVATKLAEARSALFITGAGLSADSGLPTYRGVGGLYDGGVTEEGLPIEMALSGPVFQRRPDITWKYIHQIEAACRGARPNAAHRVMASLESRLDRCWVLTQNVDGLHTAAGSQNVVAIHGGVHRLRCTSCAWKDAVEDYSHLDAVPDCPQCGELVRPDVVLFEEQLPAAAVALYEREIARRFDIVFAVGTTAVFPYIAGPVWLARRQGAVTVEINPGESEVSGAVDHHLRAGAAAAMTGLAARLGLPVS